MKTLNLCVVIVKPINTLRRKSKNNFESLAFNHRTLMTTKFGCSRDNI